MTDEKDPADENTASPTPEKKEEELEPAIPLRILIMLGGACLLTWLLTSSYYKNQMERQEFNYHIQEFDKRMAEYDGMVKEQERQREIEKAKANAEKEEK